MLFWRSYTTDLGRSYPIFALSIEQANDNDSDIDPLTLLPTTVTSNLIDISNSCAVSGLTARILSLWDINGANWRINYPVPFSDNLAASLTANFDIQAWEFIGERIKYGRLRRMLSNV